MAFCVDCGAEIPEKAKFCPFCGNSQYTIHDESKFSNSETVSNGQTSRSNSPNLYGSVNLLQLPEGYTINDRYTVKEKLGQGGFAAVYRVYDQNFEIDKALKVFTESFSSDKESVEDLRRESRIMINLFHERIVRIYDVKTDSSIKYIDMEYFDGIPLSEYKLKYDGKRLPEEEVKEIGKKVTEGLQHAHDKRVIHKDIKPQNILINDEKEVKITDFGISDTVRTSMSRVQNTTSSGTLAYMAPEQISGEEVGFEVDVYSLGALLYELLVGNPPFYKGDLHYQIFNVKPKEIDGVSDEMNALLQQCLEKNYDDRFSTSKDIFEILSCIEKKISNDETIEIALSSQKLKKNYKENISNNNSVPHEINKNHSKNHSIMSLFILVAAILVIIIGFTINESQQQNGTTTIKSESNESFLEDIKGKWEILTAYQNDQKVNTDPLIIKLEIKHERMILKAGPANEDINVITSYIEIEENISFRDYDAKLLLYENSSMTGDCREWWAKLSNNYLTILLDIDDSTENKYIFQRL